MGYRISDYVMVDVMRYLPLDKVWGNSFEADKLGGIIYTPHDSDLTITFDGDGIIRFKYITPDGYKENAFDTHSYIFKDVADKDMLNKMIDMLK